MIAKSGDPAPASGAAFARFSNLVMADGGVAAFKATLAGVAIDDDNRESFWLHRSGILSLITQAGRKAPDPVADLRFSHFETPIALNRSGQAAFFARTRDKEGGFAEGSGIWAAGSGGVSIAANGNTPAVAGAPGVVFLPQSFEQPFANDAAISPSGQTIFRGFLAGPSVDETNLNGLWSYSETTGLRLMQRAGEEAVGMSGALFRSFPSVPTINAAGDTAFLAFFDHMHSRENGALASSAQEDTAEIGLGLWLRRAAGELSHVFAIGDQAPGIDGDVHFVDTFDPVMNATSRVAFLGAVRGEGVSAANELGLWSSGLSPDKSLRLICRQGDAAPSSEHGFVFGTFLEPSLNAAGQATFMASGYRLEGETIVSSAFGIWGQDRAGVLRLVARVGQSLEIAPGDERIIASLTFASKTGGEDGRARGLNDLGQVVLQASFTDGSSGIFVSDALSIPEANYETLLFLAAACLRLTTRSRDHKED
jgi:hypothetical protein